MGVMLWRRGQAAYVLLALSFSVAHTGCARDAAHASESVDSSELGAPLPRRFMPRLSVATEYAPCHVQPRGGDIVERSSCAPADPDPAPVILDRARHASDILSRTPDARALRTVALVDLEWSADSGIALDRSIAYLRTASKLAPQPASSLADLSAAYLLRAERTQNVRDLLEAAEAADRALTTEPSNRAASFNRALAMEQLGLTVQADEAWTRYLAIDSSSGWAWEARTDRARLRALAHTRARSVATPETSSLALVSADPGRASTVAWNDLLGRWGEAELSGDTAVANSTLREVKRLGDALVSGGADPTVAAAVSAIHAVLPDQLHRQALARAHRDFSRVQQMSAIADYSGALTWARRTNAEAAAFPVLREQAQLALGSMLMYAGQMTRAERMVRGVRVSVDSTRNTSFAARADWILGTIYIRTGRYERAFTAYRSAASLFTAAHERENAGAVLSLAAEAAFSLGEYATGFEYSRRATVTLAHRPESLWRHSTFTVAATSAAADGLPHAALDLAEESIAAADANGVVVYRTESRLAAARLQADVGDTIAALNGVARARALMVRVPTGSRTEWMAAQLQLVTAALTDRHGAAIVALDSAVRTFKSLHTPVWLVRALLQRSDLRFSLGDIQRGRIDLESALALLTTEGSQITDGELRASFLESARRAFDHEMLLAVARGDIRGALGTLEEERVTLRSPRDAKRGTRVSRGIPRLAAGTILDFAVVGDTVLTWTIARGDVRLTRTEVPHARLTSLIERTQASLEMGHDARGIPIALTELYDMLLRPALGASDDADITIVADGELGAIPFAALYDSAEHAYFVERHAIRYAASLADLGGHFRSQGYGRGPMALVSDPAFDRSRFPALARLPGAHAEVAALARLRPGAITLDDRNATARNVLLALRRAAFFHYAGHALFDHQHPEQSVLLLAPDQMAPTGALTAQVISRIRLTRHPLVILSACETMRPGSGRSGDVSGLARAFVHAGARGVVGSQWRADDRATLALMLGFYTSLEETHDVARSLRAAQVALMHSQDPALRTPSAWAAFRYAGE